MSTKNTILEILEQNRGKSISGEELGAMINISRNSVWKAINELKKDGYKISAIPNKGYCLSEESDIISVQGISPFLNNENLAKKIFVYSTVDSTNKMGKKLAIDGCENFTVLISNEQSEGRGRKGRSFFSPPNKGIYMSIVMKPSMSNDDCILITTAASVAISKAIKKICGIDPKIKWVNDIYVNNKKACGILTEAITDFETNTISWIILGMGINFVINEYDLPEELKDIVGGVLQNNHDNITRNQLIGEILNQVEEILPSINKRDFISYYKEHSLVLGQDINVIRGEVVYKAKAVDIDNNGALIVIDENGDTKILNTGEITIRLNHR